MARFYCRKNYENYCNTFKYKQLKSTNPLLKWTMQTYFWVSIKLNNNIAVIEREFALELSTANLNDTYIFRFASN